MIFGKIPDEEIMGSGSFCSSLKYLFLLFVALFQAALEEMGQGWVELNHTRARVQQLQNQLQDHNKGSTLEIFRLVNERQNDTMAL